jgi:CRISPR-associated endonuclease Csy4
MARKGISAEEAEQAIPDSAAERLDLPYVVLNSQTTGQQFRLFVEHRPPQEQAASGPFSAYGLSPTATVPWF